MSRTRAELVSIQALSPELLASAAACSTAVRRSTWVCGATSDAAVTGIEKLRAEASAGKEHINKQSRAKDLFVKFFMNLLLRGSTGETRLNFSRANLRWRRKFSMSVIPAGMKANRECALYTDGGKREENTQNEGVNEHDFNKIF